MPNVSIVLPSKNEEGNIKRLLQGVWDCLLPYKPELKYEVILVDDSTDKTAVIARSLGARVIKGQGQGLGQAIIDGINASDGDIVLVMDADGSHSPELIPSLLKPILQHGVDFVIGSRYVEGGDVSEWNFKRKVQSIVGVKLMQLVTGVRDSNSGFFAFKKSVLEGVELKPDSWKIMLEVLFKSNWVVKREVPIKFGDRKSGVSKNSNRERMKHAVHILKLLVWKFRRYIKFALVGGVGSIWYFLLLWVFTEYVGLWYGFSAVIATLVAITNNYLINHFWTFRWQKNTNKSLFWGWLKYVANSAVGDGIDWVVLILLTEVFGLWYMLSAFIASGVASVIKYTIARKWIWSDRKMKASDADYEWVSFYKGMPWQKYSKQNIARVVKSIVGESKVTIDIGCGSSPLGVLTDHTDYIGVDVDIQKINYMQEKKLNKIQFIVGNVLNLPFKEEYADTVLFIETIEHLDSMDEVDKAIGEISRVVKKGGRVVVAMPDFSSLLGRIMEKLYGVFHPSAYAEDHTTKLDIDSLIEICQKHQLRLESSHNLLKRDIISSYLKI